MAKMPASKGSVKNTSSTTNKSGKGPIFSGPATKAPKMAGPKSSGRGC